MKNSIIAIIPARGGSKGLPKKNISPLAGKPLISYSIEAALRSKYISDVVVTSDDDDILKIAQEHDVSSIKRPYSLAQDNTKTEPVIFHTLENITEKYDIIILLQPTSPLRDEHDIDLAFEAFIESEADALISVKKPSHSPYKAFTQTKDGYLKGIINNDYPFMPRQELPMSYYPNGAIYIIKTKEFLKHQSLFCAKTIPYEMSELKSIDIDSLDDLKYVEKNILG